MKIPDPVVYILVYALLILSLLQVLKWFLMEFGEWWRWFTAWAAQTF